MIATSVVLWAAVVALVVFIYYVRFVEATALRVERIEVAIRDLPPQLVGLRIVHLSDLHLRGQKRALDLGLRAIDLAMAERADLT
jgi:predicted MPP superfamily phosphohydrolase